MDATSEEKKKCKKKKKTERSDWLELKQSSEQAT